MDLNKKLSSLQEISKTQLSKILSVCTEKKNIVLESRIIKPLEKVCGVQWLKGHGIEKIYKLEDISPNFETTTHTFYMMYSDMKIFKLATEQIRSQLGDTQKKFHIIVIPRYIYLFEEELEELGLLDSTVHLHSFNWFPILLDERLLSLEIPHIYGQFFIQKDYTLLPSISRNLWQLFFVVGKPKFNLILGKLSHEIYKQLNALAEDIGETDKFDSDFGALIIMDRTVDYPSVLLTPGNYSALLSEVYKVSGGVCDYREENPEKIDSKCNPKIPKHQLNITMNGAQDYIYNDLKNRYFTEVTTVLSNLTKQLRNETESSKEMALEEIKRYVQTQLHNTKMQKKLLANHLQAAETIVNILGPRYENQREIEQDILKNTNRNVNVAYLDELIYTENDEFVVLRLFCLIAITQKLNDSEISSFWRKFLHQFGFKYGNAYYNLIKTEFINEPTSMVNIQSKIKIPIFGSNQFYGIANRLKQIPGNPEKISLKYPTCASYVFGGIYIPLITQIASFLLNSTPIDEIKTKLEMLGPLTVKSDHNYPLHSRSVLFYVIGGVSYAEIAACNLLETLTGSRIVIMSDKTINGNDIMEDILTFPR